MKIFSTFDSGNIDVISIDNPENIQVQIRKDTNSDFLQWFHFRLTDAAEYPCKIKITNASKTSYPKWDGYNAVASYDREFWFRVPTSFDGENLIIDHTPEYNSVYYAYFAPYSYEQHQDLIHTAQQSDLCVLQSIGATTEGRSMDLLVIGTPDKEKKKVWIIARQHPGESMAEWFMEGLIYRLLDEADPVSRKLLDKAVFYLVPNMNPDGSIHGNLRSNAAGANLNREWETPSVERSSEVFYVRNKMDEIGVDLGLDIHGDEELPYNFISGGEGIPKYDERHAKLLNQFRDHWATSSPDFQTKIGYDIDEPGKANMTVGSNQIGERFDCLSMTIEMPFKDNNNLVDPLQGWSAERSSILGASVLNTILDVVDDLR